MSPHNSQLVACGGEVVVVAACNADTAGGVAAADDVLVVVGVVATVAIWVQQCLMRLRISLQFAFVLVVVTPTRKEPSWWDR